jgi:hypothetical protein
VAIGAVLLEHAEALLLLGVLKAIRERDGYGDSRNGGSC